MIEISEPQAGFCSACPTEFLDINTGEAERKQVREVSVSKDGNNWKTWRLCDGCLELLRSSAEVALSQHRQEEKGQVAYKIRNTETGEYSTGGVGPRWTKAGKTWSTLGGLKSHLRQNAKYRAGFVLRRGYWELTPEELAECLPAEWQVVGTDGGVKGTAREVFLAKSTK